MSCGCKVNARDYEAQHVNQMAHNWNKDMIQHYGIPIHGSKSHAQVIEIISSITCLKIIPQMFSSMVAYNWFKFMLRCNNKNSTKLKSIDESI